MASKQALSLCLYTAVFLAGHRSVAAGNWPQPAAGVSASGDPELLLTFDDGPHETYTPIVLDALKKHNIQAIFFWIGIRLTGKNQVIKERRAIIERAVRAGHLIGNHTISHARLCAVSNAEAQQEIDDNALLYTKITGLPIPLLRIPYGARCKALDKILATRELKHMHWDLDPREFLHHSATIAFQYVTNRLRRLQNGKRVVLLMHDTKQATAKALPLILNWIDEENKKRRRQRRRPIRVIGGSQWFEEMHPVPLLRWTQSSAITAARKITHALTMLIP